MSRYEWKKDNRIYSLGWDPPLKTFFAQIHDETIPEDSEEDWCVLWLGADFKGQFPEIEPLLKEFEKHLDGEKISEILKIHLSADKKGFNEWTKEIPLPENVQKRA